MRTADLPLAAGLAGEWPGTDGLLGVLLVSSAIRLLATGRGKLGAMTPQAMGWAFAAAACTAGYVVCDAQGARQAHSPLAYGAAMSVLNAIVWTL